jgi:uncharacterized membrane protein SpoIIM required for sporulation
MFSEVEWSLVGWSVAKCSERLTKSLPDIIRRHIDHMKFAAFMAFSFIIFLHNLLVSFIICEYGFMLCIIMFIIL